MLIREHIVLEKFVKDSDPIYDLGIGSRELIKRWLEKHYIKNYTINDDLSIDVNGQVHLFRVLTGNLPEYIQFNEVHKDFIIGENAKLTSLRGCPRKVGRDFDCMQTSIKNLKYSPEYIGCDFMCSQMYKLESLDGISKIINGFFFCRNHANNKIFEISDIPKYCIIKRGSFLVI